MPPIRGSRRVLFRQARSGPVARGQLDLFAYLGARPRNASPAVNTQPLRGTPWKLPPDSLAPPMSTGPMDRPADSMFAASPSPASSFTAPRLVAYPPRSAMIGSDSSTPADADLSHKLPRRPSVMFWWYAAAN